MRNKIIRPVPTYRAETCTLNTDNAELLKENF